MWNPSPNIDELRTLLQRLYPNVDISSKGVTLVASQIRSLDQKRDLFGNRIDQPMHHHVTSAPTFHPQNFYGDNGR